MKTLSRKFATLALSLLITTLLVGITTMAQINSTLSKPPAAKIDAKKTTVHDETLVDNYHWLRDKSNAEVISYLEAENAYTDAVMKPSAAFQEALYKEMVGRIKETDIDPAYRQGDYLYYKRTEQGKQYPIYARKKRGDQNAPEQVTLELNQMADGLKFMAVGDYEVSPDGKLLAYTTDTTGFREHTLQIKDLMTGKLLPERIARVNSVAWASDNKTLFYVVDDAQTKRPFRLYRHTVGHVGGAEKDTLVYEEKDEMFNLYVSPTRSGAYVVATSASHTTSEVRVIPADKPSAEPRVIEPREASHEYYIDHHTDRFYIRTNEHGAKNFKLVAAPIADPSRKNWKELMPHRKDVMLEDVDLFANHLVVTSRENGLPELIITDLRDNKTHNLEFPEPAYTAAVNVNKEFDSEMLRFSYQSLVTSPSIYDYNMRTRERQLVKQTPVLGGYDPARYTSERIHAMAADGTRIPISLVYKKDFRRDGQRPMFLQAYGSYGYAHPISFTSARLSLIDRGVVYAVAHIRGGGEMGKEWHDQGKMMSKKNTFTDFIAAAEHLIKEGYTSRDRLVITGGSAGGLLMGAVANMRPDLFKAIVSHVPFVDVINTMLDETLPLTVSEFQEWGNPKEKAAYEYMKSYSPYENIEAKEYPTMLVKTSLNDSQVMYWEPAKYVARLRATKADKNPLLLKTNMGAGHGGASGRYDSLREVAFDYAFVLSQLGVTQ